MFARSSSNQLESFKALAKFSNRSLEASFWCVLLLGGHIQMIFFIPNEKQLLQLNALLIHHIV